MPRTIERRAGASEPPVFLRLIAHPVRWRLLAELARSDRAVHELTDVLGEQQSLVSYHLGQLRAGGLVRARRSSADGRDSYYTIDLSRCGEQLGAAGAALHPGLGLAPAPPSSARRRAGSRGAHRVLFLCTGNSARSQMAEALIEHMSEGRIRAASAGSAPKPLHPNAVRAMRKRSIDISGNRTKHLDEFLGERFEYVITLCDRVREVCPEFPFHPNVVHWSVPDPAADGLANRTTYPAFERLATELEVRIGFLLQLLDDQHDWRSAHAG